MEKIFVIGDIHGCFQKLCTLMDRIDYDGEQDTLVFLGDYIDRGYESYDVVQYLAGLSARRQRIVFLKGNHEQMLENYLAGTMRFVYIVNGGAQTLENYQAHRAGSLSPLIPDSHLKFFSGLLLYYEIDDYVFVHAGLRDNVPLRRQRPEDLLWIRDSFIRSDHDFGKRIIFGHTPFAEPLVLPNKIGIDTGAVYGNKLTCLELPACKFYFS